MTYPDQALSELLSKFVLVKVDHDAEPDLVKHYGVQPLPDVRLLGPDGKQLDKLIGTTSAPKLASHLEAALDRLAGREPDVGADSSKKDGPTAELAPVEVTPDSVGLAILRGTSFLRSAWRRGWSASPRFAPDDLVLDTWACCGLERCDADVSVLTSRLLESPPLGTYRAALRACALQRLGGDDVRPQLETCARFLESTQLANGQWTYGPAEEGMSTPALGDHSNSAYALLGLAACKKAGVVVSRDVIEKATRWWLQAQNEDGGFGYRTDRESSSYASMTASGLHCLLLARDELAAVKSPVRGAVADDVDPRLAPSIARSSAWLEKHFSASENVGSAIQEGRRLYGLFAVERACDVESTGSSPTHAVPIDWCRQGAKHLLESQRADGSWDDGTETPIPDTCFALLFLARASASKER